MCLKVYRVHQDATLLPVDLNCGHYEVDGRKISTVSASASRDDQGRIHVTLCNADPNNNCEVLCDLRGVEASAISARVLTADAVNAHNTFNAPEQVKPAEFDGAKLTRDGFALQLPSKSVVALEIK